MIEENIAAGSDDPPHSGNSRPIFLACPLGDHSMMKFMLERIMEVLCAFPVL
jgi:hypothetical protein